MKPTLDIIIVNWNSGDYLFECLSSINNSNNEDINLQNVVIVDNASSDNSLSKIDNFDLPTKVIHNKVNLGFGKACNIGAAESTADFLLMLNPDSKIFDKSLSCPVRFLTQETNSNIGIVGIKIIDDNNNVSRNCARFPSAINIINYSLGLDKLFPKLFLTHFMSEWDHLDSCEVDQVMGSFLLIRGEVFKKLKGYDERFFVYYEDLDLSLRAKLNGYKSYYLSTCQIYHKGGGVSDQVKAKRLFYSQDSKLQYSKKHFRFSQYIIISFFVLFIEPVTRVIFSSIRGSFLSIGEILLAYKMLYTKIILSR
jgi:GT2 family glycosyltransferase